MSGPADVAAGNIPRVYGGQLFASFGRGLGAVGIALALALAGTCGVPGRAHADSGPTGRPTGRIIGSFNRPLPMNDPDFQFHGGCAIESRDVRTRKKIVIRNPRNVDDCVRGPLMSPDGARVLFSADGKDNEMEVRLSGADGRGERTLAHGPDRYLFAWSPDSRLVALATEKNYARWIVIDPDAGRVWSTKPCAPWIRRDVFQWAADGSGLVVVTEAPPAPQLGFSVVECGWAGTRRDLGPRIPDSGGEKLLALSPDAGSLFIGGFETSVVTVATGASQPVWPRASVEQPFWSPDSAWVAAVVSPRPGSVAIVSLFNVRTHESKRLGYYQTYELSWWAPQAKGPDCDARVRAALGSGEATTGPLRLDLR